MADTPPAPGSRVFQWAQENGEVGGVLTSHRQLTDQLRRAGMLVEYVDTGSPARALGTVPRLGGRRSLHLFHITRLWRAAVLAPVFALLPGRTGLVLHSGSVARQLSRGGRARRALLGATLHAYDEIWAVNDQIRTVLPLDLKDRVRVVTPFSADASSGEPVSRNEPERDPHLLSVTTNAGLPHYNADLAVEAVRLVRHDWRDARLRVLAYGADGEHLARFRASVAGLDWVETTFDASPADVADVLRRSAVFLRPTSWDGDSVVVREALAAGARVVAADTAPRPAGVEVSQLDARAFATAVLRGGPVSDGSGLSAVSMLDAAMGALRHLG